MQGGPNLTLYVTLSIKMNWHRAICCFKLFVCIKNHPVL